jgi:hypothetical protein
MPQANFQTPGTQLSIAQANAIRQQQLANMLQHGALEPMQGQMAGKVYVAPSWTQGLAKALQMYGSLKAQDQAIAEQERAGQIDQDERAKFAQAMQGGNLQEAYALGMGSQSPTVQQAAFHGMGQLPAMQERRSLREEERSWRDQDREDRQEAQRQMLQERANDRQASVAPYWQIQDTDRGLYWVNARAKEQYPMLDDQGKQLVRPNTSPSIQGNIARERASGKLEGEAYTQAELDLQKTIDQSGETIRLVDEMIGSEDGKTKEHPGFKMAVGKSRMIGMQSVPGTDAKAFDIRLAQIKGKQFLQAFESLKGGGHITEIEGQKATEAISRMDAATTEEEFVSASREFQGIVKSGLERAKAKAVRSKEMPGKGAPPPPRGGLPSADQAPKGAKGWNTETNSWEF